MDENRKDIWLIDTTLRDGEQAPGVVFTLSEKIRIASLLMEAGVDEIEAGIPIMGEDERDTLRILKKELPAIRLTSWCRGNIVDLDMADACNTGSVHISFPASAILCNAFGKTDAWVLEQMERLIPVAVRRFDHVSVGAQDATRCDTDFLDKMIYLAGECGARRFRIADTVGCATPMMINTLFERLQKQDRRLQLEFHGHNDLGMATANTISAISAGANAVSLTVNGLGERAGNARLEEVTAALSAALGFSSRINFYIQQDLCHLVADITKNPIPRDKPITGADVFTHESGIHCRALIRDLNSYQPFPPHSVGRRPFHIRIGKFSGTAAVNHVLGMKGMEVDMETAARMMPMIRRMALEKKRSLTDQELETVWMHHAV